MGFLYRYFGLSKIILAFLSWMTFGHFPPKLGAFLFNLLVTLVSVLNVDQIYDEDGAVSSGTLEELVPMLDHSFSSSLSFGQNKLECLS
jgi:hypothetical protein